MFGIRRKVNAEHAGSFLRDFDFLLWTRNKFRDIERFSGSNQTAQTDTVNGLGMRLRWLHRVYKTFL